ncbi:granzyme F-like isoform X1 [Mesocricetus auratus]|uniref:Granzyme F-like isoform X1 n=1 Tax=Mesocricetus auratus TaxID=10036 RepID=A0ABM2X1G2_MESAU|nr:granzyme F-like isoform X1 [Mesocricetus auratus]
MSPVLILLTFLLPSGAGAEEIIGGHEVKPHSRPYMAFIQFVRDDGKKGRCGGFLVRDNFVLTAAHCLGSSMKVTLGAHNIKAQEETQQIIPVAKAIPHPAYNPMDYTNDIMLLKLERKARRTKAVRPLKLPRVNAQVKPGHVCRLPGWGSTSLNATRGTAVLQEAVLITEEDQKCKLYFSHYSRATQICAGDPNKIQSAFKGDSGGPLVCDNRAYGVVSYGKSKRIAPGIFTKVVSFLQWIKRSMKPV